MGIRVACPNGHRLHLKAHLAGKRGVCPECGARFRIPGADAAGPAGDGPVAQGVTESAASVGSPTPVVAQESPLERIVTAATAFEEPLDELFLGRGRAGETPGVPEGAVSTPLSPTEVSVRADSVPVLDRMKRRRRRSLGVTLLLVAVVVALAVLLFLELR